MAFFLGLPGWAGTRKVKPIWILLKQEIVSGISISWAICKSASRSRQMTMPAPDHSFFTGRTPFLPPNQQHQSTEGIALKAYLYIKRPICFNRDNWFPLKSNVVYLKYSTENWLKNFFYVDRYSCMHCLIKCKQNNINIHPHFFLQSSVAGWLPLIRNGWQSSSHCAQRSITCNATITNHAVTMMFGLMDLIV